VTVAAGSTPTSRRQFRLGETVMLLSVEQLVENCRRLAVEELVAPPGESTRYSRVSFSPAHSLNTCQSIASFTVIFWKKVHLEQELRSLSQTACASAAHTIRRGHLGL